MAKTEAKVFGHSLGLKLLVSRFFSRAFYLGQGRCTLGTAKENMLQWRRSAVRRFP